MHSLFRKYSIDISDKGKHNALLGWISVNCPNCGDSSYHGGFNTRNGAYHCFKCEATGGVNIFAELARIDYATAKLEYSNLFSFTKKSKWAKELINKNVQRVDLPGSSWFFQNDKRYKNYLEERRVPYQDNDWRNLQATSRTDPKYSNRIVIPIYHEKKLVSWQTRSILPDVKAKYISASKHFSIISIKNMLYGMEPYRDVVGVVEGVFDCWALGPKFVCVFGCTLSHFQFQALAKKQRVFFCFDNNDRNSQNNAKKYCRKLKILGVEAINLVWHGTDPCDLSNEDRLYLAKEVL